MNASAATAVSKAPLHVISEESQQAAASAASFWSDFAPSYSELLEPVLLQTARTLRDAVQISTAHRVLDCACGTGLAAVELAGMLDKGKATLTCVDLSAGRGSCWDAMRFACIDLVMETN